MQECDCCTWLLAYDRIFSRQTNYRNERFTVSKDGNRLDYEISVTDPVNLVGTVAWDAAWHWIPGAKILPYECELQ